VADLAEFFTVAGLVVKVIAVLVIDVRLNTATLSFNPLPVHKALKAQMTVSVAAHALSKGCNTSSILSCTVARFVAVAAHRAISLSTVRYRLRAALVDAFGSKVKYCSHLTLLVVLEQLYCLLD
jgi:hypothetical protein